MEEGAPECEYPVHPSGNLPVSSADQASCRSAGCSWHDEQYDRTSRNAPCRNGHCGDIAEVGLSAQTELSDGSAPAHRLSPARAASDQGNFSGIHCRSQRCGLHSSDRVSGSDHPCLCDHHLDGTAL